MQESRAVNEKRCKCRLHVSRSWKQVLLSKPWRVRFHGWFTLSPWMLSALKVRISREHFLMPPNMDSFAFGLEINKGDAV